MTEPDRNQGAPNRRVDLRHGTAHADDYGSLRWCGTTDCPIRHTASDTCRTCGEPTKPWPPREET